MEVKSNIIVDGTLIITEKTIDVRELIRAKNPRALRFLPRFVISYLRRIIHESEINKLLYVNREKFGLEFVDEIIKTFGAKVEFHGLENIENESRFLVAANHPLGGLDALTLMQTVGLKHPKILFPANDFLMYLPNLSVLLIPINKVGAQPSNAVRILESAFASDSNILYFPAGLASRKIKGKIVDLEWKKTFIQKARQHQRNVIPVFISGRNSKRFYRIAKWRKFLGIKTNIEMMFLSDEMFRQKDKTISIYFGKPIPHTFFDKSKKDIEWAEYVKQIVYSLPQNV